MARQSAQLAKWMSGGVGTWANAHVVVQMGIGDHQMVMNLDWFSALPPKVQELLAGAASDFLGGVAAEIALRLMDGVSSGIRKRFEPEPTRAALGAAIAQALAVTVGPLASDEDLLCHYLDILGRWTERPAVISELARLIAPKQRDSIDMLGLRREFAALGYDADYLGLDLNAFVASLVDAFRDACDEREELRGLIDTRLLRNLTAQMQGLSSSSERTAVAAEFIAEATRTLLESSQPASPRIRHNLPQRDYDRFIGRTAELSSLFNYLAPEHRAWVIVIDGIGGIGKSALALEAAYHYIEKWEQLRESERFQSIIWVSAKTSTLTGEGVIARLHAPRTLGDIYKTIAVVFGLEDAVNRARAEDRSELVRRELVSRRTLLVIDNMDTFDDDSVLSFLQELPSPTKAIVTSRHRINVALPLRLSKLSEGDAYDLIYHQSERKGVMLTVEETSSLCKQTDGVPLAIVWCISQIAYPRSVKDVLGILGQRTGPVSQFVFAELLEMIRDKPAFRLLQSLSVFSQSATREALGYVTGLGENERDSGLETLERLSLVTRADNRFSMLQLTQSYLQNESPSMEAAEICGRVIAYYLELIESTESDRLDEERMNIVGMIEDQARCDSINVAHLTVRLVRAYNDYLYNHGYWDDVLRCSQIAADLCQQLGDLTQQVDILLEHCEFIHYLRNEFDEAEMVTSEALSLARRIGYASGKAKALRNLGVMAREKGDLIRARDYMLEALANIDSEGQQDLVRVIKGVLASVYRSLQNFGEAQQMLADEISACRLHGEAERDRLSVALCRMGTCLLESGNPERARVFYEESLQIDSELGRNSSMGFNFFKLARCAESMAQVSVAQKLASQALEVFSSIGDQKMVGKVIEFQVSLKHDEQHGH